MDTSMGQSIIVAFDAKPGMCADSHVVVQLGGWGETPSSPDFYPLEVRARWSLAPPKTQMAPQPRVRCGMPRLTRVTLPKKVEYWNRVCLYRGVESPVLGHWT